MKTWVTTSGYKIIRVLFGRSNVFLLTNGVSHILIDSSIGNQWRKLQKRLNQLNISHLDYLILTHTHFDHAGNARKIKEKYNAKIIVSRSETSNLESGENLSPGGTNFIIRGLVRLIEKSGFLNLKTEPCSSDVLIESPFDLKKLSFNAFILPTPGHTIGSLSIIIDDEIAIVGDAMFGVFKGSIFPPFANDVPQMIKSWELLLATKCSLFLPSHGTANSRKLVQKNHDKRKNQF